MKEVRAEQGRQSRQLSEMRAEQAELHAGLSQFKADFARQITQLTQELHTREGAR